jgi:phosphoglycolate phosphatase
MAIKAILFDKDGTLIDITATWVPAYREMLAELFDDDAERVERLLVAAGYDPAKGGFKAGSTLAGGTTREIVDVWWPGLDAEDLSRKIHLLDVEYRDLAVKHLKPLMPLAPILTSLRDSGYKLGIATNDTQASATSHLHELGIAALFDMIVGSDNVTVPKPAGDMVRLFSRGVEVAPEEVAMVGDNPHDMEEARKGGAGLAIGVLSGNSDSGDLDHLADHIIPSIAHLEELLRKLG